MFVRTGPTIHEFPGVEIPLKNTLSSCTLHLISSHVLRYLLFSLDVRANQSNRAWVPWSIDFFEKYSTFVYFTCIISSHIRIYLLFSFGFSGEPVRPFVSSLEYRFLWKYTIYVYFTSNIISCTQISLIFFWMFGRTSPIVREFPEV